jgi:hypothetical protein
MASRRTDERVVKRIASNTWSLAAVLAWLEYKTIDRIQRVARKVGKTSIPINPEVTKPTGSFAGVVYQLAQCVNDESSLLGADLPEVVAAHAVRFDLVARAEEVG